MNNLGKLPAQDTFRIRCGSPKQRGVAYPLDGAKVTFWMGLDPEVLAEAFCEGDTNDGMVQIEEAPDDGIVVTVPASTVKTCVREAVYYWRVRIEHDADNQFTIDDGTVQFSDKVI